MMTSPLVATLGLSMMIPLSVFADYARGLARLSPQFFLGSGCIFVSYLLESWAEAPEEDAEADDDDEGGPSSSMSSRRRGRERAPSAGAADEMLDVMHEGEADAIVGYS